MLKADDLKKLNFSRRYQRRLLAFIFLLFFLFPNGIMAMQIDLKNGSGEDKKEWPVILKAYHVFGKNLSPGSLDLSKLLIKDSSGQSLPYDLVHLPPYDQPGNDLIVFLISLKKDQTLTVMITQTQKKGLHKKIDLVQSPHNLIPGAGFDTAEDLSKHWQGQGKLDSSVKHDGAASLLLNTKHRAKMMLKKKMVLHVGSPYIFGGWGKTENVARSYLYEIRYGRKAAHFKLSGFNNGYLGDMLIPSDSKIPKHKIAQILANKRQAYISPQASTRDWRPLFFWNKGFTEWGMEKNTVKAQKDSSSFSINFIQLKAFWMKGQFQGKWWLDSLYLMEQAEARVRFDLALEKQMTQGLFFFTRPVHAQIGNSITRWTPSCVFPFAHEKLQKLSANGLRGHEINLLVGLYHKGAVKGLKFEVKGGSLKSAEGNQLKANTVEWLPGLLGEKTAKSLRAHDTALDLQGAGIPYFLLSFPTGKDSKPGAYTGTLTISLAGKIIQTVPLRVAVQDLTLPKLKDTYLGWIFQGNQTPHTDESYKLYQRGGFNSITIFRHFFKYNKKNKPGEMIDLKHLEKKVNMLAKYGITSGLCLFSEFDLGPRWSGGHLYKKVKGDKKAWQAEVLRLEAFFKKHPEWPRLIYMTWDEPRVKEAWIKGKHGGVNPKMGWLPEILPNAPHNLDVQPYVLAHLLKYYSMPTLDDPPEGIGPEVYDYIHAQGKDFGVAGAKQGWEVTRYHIGMFMATTGARYYHQWHLAFPNKNLYVEDGVVRRTIDFVSSGEGVTDYKVFRLLKAAMKKAAKDPAKKKSLDKANAYLKKIFVTWNGDHSQKQGVPDLGLAYSWGYDQFYDDWRREMTRHAAILSGVIWVK